MTRCNYLTIDCEEAEPDWWLHLGGTGPLSFLLLNLSGIVQQPLDGGRFHSQEQINDLFRQVEEKAGLLIDVDDVWLPNQLFPAYAEKSGVGEVYRVQNEVFATALRYREGRLGLEKFQASLERAEGAVTYSEEETVQFQLWFQRLVEAARDTYPKNKDRELRWIEKERA